MQTKYIHKGFLNSQKNLLKPFKETPAGKGKNQVNRKIFEKWPQKQKASHRNRNKNKNKNKNENNAA